MKGAPLIAIVGRPNVGKSTLFNRLIGRRQAIVSSVRGTTRDRVYGETVWRGVRLRFVDAGGFEFGRSTDQLASRIQRQLRRAIEEADYLLVVGDAHEGPVPVDQMIVETLRRTDKPLGVVVNKADHRLAVSSDWFSLGLKEVQAISALHGLGIGTLLDHLVTRLPAHPAASARQAGMAVAIVGRPNVGKSSLVNALLQEERVIVSDEPCTTRDAIDTHLLVKSETVTLIDTAGLKRRGKVRDPVEQFAMTRTLEAIGRSDIVLLLLDGTMGVVNDDRRFLERVIASGRGLVLLVNKWDAARRVAERTLIESVHRQLPAARFAPIIPISAKTGLGIHRVLATARDVFRMMQQPWPQEELSALLHRLWKAVPPPRVRGRVVRYHGARWVGGRPVRIQIMTTPAGQLPVACHQSLHRRLQAHPRFAGVPLVLGVEAPSRP